MNILTRLFDFLLNMPPFGIVYPDEGGIFLRGGKYKRTLSAGFYWKWPFYDRIRKTNIKDQVINLPNQSITTIDRKILALSGTVRYEIEDAKKAILDVLDYDSSLQNLAMSLIAEYTTRAENIDHDRGGGIQRLGS